MFADDYPRFIETSGLKPKPARMNQRYEALYAANRDIFDGARVLDLASHDGRWSFAALQTGAAHVTGVEVRQDFVDKARETFAHYGQDPETYRFVCGDVFDVLAREKFDVDVVLCLGYLYHTWRHTELLYRIHGLAPTHLIVDTRVVPGARSFVRLFRERNPDDLLSAAREAYSLDRVLVGHPTVPALRMMLAAYGFEVEDMYDWAARLASHPGGSQLSDYAQGRRVTLRCRSGLPATAAASEAAAGSPASPGPRRALGPSRTPARPPLPGRRWRQLVNQGLAKATGYELRRVSPTR
ncbi:MAG: class I SAM-dependent methyltransferase [Nocardioidaceae bacterium]